MSTRNRVITLSGVAVLAAIGFGGPSVVPAVGAQAPPPTMVVDPTTLTFGTQVVVSGDGCVDPGTGSGTGLSVVVQGRSLHEPTPDDPQGEILGLAKVAADGTWTLDVAIPERSPGFDPATDFSRNIRGTCGVFDPASTIFEYPEVPVQFDVPDTTTSTAPTSTVPSTTAPASPAPAPAQPVAGAATFTG